MDDIAQGEELVDKIMDVKIAPHKTMPNGDMVLQFLIAFTSLIPFQPIYGFKPDTNGGLV